MSVVYKVDRAIITIATEVTEEAMIGLVQQIDRLSSEYFYKTIELRISSPGGTMHALDYYLEAVRRFGQRDLTIHTRALSQTGSAAAAMLSMGNGRCGRWGTPMDLGAPTPPGPEGLLPLSAIADAGRILNDGALSKSTRESYGRALSRLREWMRAHGLVELDNFLLALYLAHLYREGASPSVASLAAVAFLARHRNQAAPPAPGDRSAVSRACFRVLEEGAHLGGVASLRGLRTCSTRPSRAHTRWADSDSARSRPCPLRVLTVARSPGT